MKRNVLFLVFGFLILCQSVLHAQISTQNKTISKADYHDKTLAMLVGMCGGFLSGYEYLRKYDTPDGYFKAGATQSVPAQPLIGLPDDWFVYMGGTCGGSTRDEHNYGNWQMPNGDMNSDDDSHIDIFNQYLLNKYGLSITFQEIKQAWMYYKVSDYGGGEGAIQVMRDKNLIAPQCGQRDHGNSGHWLPESYIEAETMGAAFPGMPFKASDMTDRFQHITGEGENVEWGKYWAAAHAIAFFETDARVAMQKALGSMPANSRIRQMYDITKALFAKYPTDWRAAAHELWFDVPKSNPMSVGFNGVMMLSDVNNGSAMLSIFYGANDYDKTLRIVSLIAGDADCTASTVCGLLGIIKGMAGTPQPFKDRLYRNGAGRWINDVAHAFAIKANWPASFTFEELTNMYQQNAEAAIRANGGTVSGTAYAIQSESGNIPQVATTNWGFEDGTLNGWKTWKSGNATIWNERQCDDKGDGNCNAATGQRKGTIMADPGAEAKLYQTITGLTPGATYRIEGRMNTAANHEIHLYAENYGGPYIYTSMRNGNTPYRYQYLTVTLGASSTSMDVGLHAVKTANGGWCSIDDIIVRQVENPAKATRYEAEKATVNAVDINSNQSASGGKYIGGMCKTDSYVEFNNLVADYTGEYTLRVSYANAGVYAQQKVEVNGEFIGYVEIGETGDWGIFSQNITEVPVNLQKGTNTVRFSFYKECAEIDYIDMQSPYENGSKPADDAELVDGGIYKIISRKSGKVLDVVGSIADGADVVQNTFTGTPTQYYRINKINGLYSICPIKSTQAVEVSGWKTGNGDNVALWTNNKAACQLWAILDTDNGYMKVLNQNSGKALDVAGASTTDGANVFEWEYLGGTNQQWKFEFVGTDENVLPSAIPGKLVAEAFIAQTGVITKGSPDVGGGSIMANIDNGDWADYFVSVTTGGNYRFAFRYTSATTGGTIRILSNSTELGHISLAGTGGWNNWKTDSIVCALPAGTQTLRLQFEGGSALFDLNWIDVQYPRDCKGVINGTAQIDACGTCSGGTTGIVPCTTQTISLVKGWNLISTNLSPTDSSIASLFKDLDVQEIKNTSSYWRKGQVDAFNSLTKITSGEGYLVNMNAAGTLSIVGTPIVIRNSQFVIDNGWHLIGCPYQTTTLFSTIFNTTNCSTIKNFEGFWQPNGTNNSIQTFESGKGYFIKK